MVVMVDRINFCSDCQKKSLLVSEAYFHAIEPTKDALICQIKKICATCKQCSGVYLLFDHLKDKWNSNIEKIEGFEKIIHTELRTLLHKNRYCKTCDIFTSDEKCAKCKEKTETLPFVVISNTKKVIQSKNILNNEL